MASLFPTWISQILTHRFNAYAHELQGISAGPSSLYPQYILEPLFAPALRNAISSLFNVCLLSLLLQTWGAVSSISFVQMGLHISILCGSLSDYAAAPFVKNMGNPLFHMSVLFLTALRLGIYLCCRSRWRTAGYS